MSTGDEEAAVGRVRQEAPEASALSTEDALRLQSRPEEGRHLGWGEWLGEDTWVPGGLPTLGEQRTWQKLQRQYPGLAQIAAENPGQAARASFLRNAAATRVRTGLGRLARTKRETEASDSSSAEAEASDPEAHEARRTSRVIPPTSAGYTEPALSEHAPTLTHAPTSVWVSDSEAEEGEEHREVKKEVKRERQEAAKEEPPRSKARSESSRGTESLEYESRASSVGWRRPDGPRNTGSAASSSAGGPSHPPGEWTEARQRQRREDEDRLWAEWHRTRGWSGWEWREGQWRRQEDRAGYYR